MQQMPTQIVLQRLAHINVIHGIQQKHLQVTVFYIFRSLEIDIGDLSFLLVPQKVLYGIAEGHRHHGETGISLPLRDNPWAG